jgi:hypothetical protein
MTGRQHVAQIMTRHAAAAAVAAILAAAGGAHAVSGQQSCADRVTGQLSATPDAINRETDPSVETVLTWSVSMPENCSIPLRLTLAGQVLRCLSGQVRVEVPWTTTFELNAVLLRVLATETVTVHGDPGLITVSAGPEVTAEDVAKFNAQWMQPFRVNKDEIQAKAWLEQRFDAGVWETTERMSALARMYEITTAKEYLRRLDKVLKFALDFRDDRHPGLRFTDPETGEVFDFPANPLDEIRGRSGLPAWGGKSVNSGGLHRVDEVVSSLYAYSMATFARIVAEDVTLHAEFGGRAMEYANAALETTWFFIPQIRFGNAGAFLEAWLTLPLEYRDRPTESECQNAYEEARAAEPDKEERWLQMLCNCRSHRIGAGTPTAHNINLAFAMALIEVWRTLDSPFYRQSPLASRDAAPARSLFPLLVSRQQRYFVNRLHPLNVIAQTCLWIFDSLCWHFSDDLPPEIDYHAEDTSHGALDMRYLEVLRNNVHRLNALPASVGEPIPLESIHLRGFANTFLRRIAVGTHFKRNVIGRDANPVDANNGNCDGWLNLAVADVNVYHRCREMSLRIVNADNHI